MNAPEPLTARLQMLPTHLLDPSPTNPRKTFTQATIDELAASMRQVGVLQPLLVRPAFTSGRYEIVAGERRWRAATAAGLDAVPVIVRELDDKTVVRMQCIENLQREDVNPHEEAAGFRLLVSDYKYTPEQIAEEIGKSRSYVFGRLKLTELHQDVLDWIAGEEDVELSASHLLLVARIPVPKLQLQCAQEFAGRRPPHWRPLSFRAAQEHVQNKYMLALREAPWWKKDPADLVEEAGTCGGCPKRSGNARDLFHEVADPNVCTDPGCHADKRKAWTRRVRDEAEAKGVNVLPSKEAQRVLGASSRNPDPDWVRLDDKCEQDAEKRTYRQLVRVAGWNVEVAAAQDKDSGKLVELAPRDQVIEALKSIEVKVPKVAKSASGTRSPANDKQAQEKWEREQLADEAVLQAIRSRYQREPAFTREDFALVAAFVGDRMDSEAGAWRPWGLPEKMQAWGHEFEKWRTKRLAEMGAEELMTLAVCMVLSDSLMSDDGKQLEDTAARLGLDVETIRAQALAEHDAKQGTVEKAPAKRKKKAEASA